MINSNWHPISYRFGVIAAYCSNFGHCVFELPFGGGLRDIVRCSSWAHWKAHSGLPKISVNWTFFRYLLRLRRYERREIKKSAIWLQSGHFDRKFQVEGFAPPIIFARLVRPTLPLTVFTQRNFVADFRQTKCDFFTEIGRFAFSRPPLGDLGETYDDHLRLIGKHVVDFLLVLIELFSLGVTAEEMRANISWKSAISLQRGSVDPKCQVEGVAPHQPFFCSEN